VHRIKLILSSILIVNIVVTGASLLSLSGNWIFEANTKDGLLRADLELREQNDKLLVMLKIDNHVLTGDSETDGERFSVVLMHSDGSGPQHTERIRLIGGLDGRTLTGSFDNGIDHGTWWAIRKEVDADPQKGSDLPFKVAMSNLIPADRAR
jgi:hypothetical protein